MDLSGWFRTQLQSGSEGLIWAVEQLPADRLFVPPPSIKLGEWNVMRHLFHMMYYERFVALPSMRQWLGAALPPEEDIQEDAAWDQGNHDLGSLIAQFKQGRIEQIALLNEIKPDDWHSMRESYWGPKPLLWVVSKTFQHTAEHTNEVMKIVLWWEKAVALAIERAAEQSV